MKGSRILLIPAAAFILRLTGTAQLVPDANTMSLWRFDEAGGDTVADASSNGNTGHVFGNVPIVPGTYGNARRFSGDDNYISFGNDSSLQLRTEFSVEAYVKVDTLPIGWGYIIGKYDGSGGDVSSNFQLGITSDGRIEWKVGSNTYTLRSEQTVPLGDWVLITATYDGTLPSANMKIYFDSVLDTTLDRTGSAPVNTSPVVAGERKIPPDGNCQICYNRGTTIDEIRISNIERNPTHLFTVDDSTAALWRFDEISGDTVTDVSGNGNTGQVLGDVPIVPGTYGNGRRFSGDNNYINFGNGSSLQLMMEFSVEAYVKVDTLPIGWGYIIGKYDGSGGDVSSNFQLGITSDGRIEWKVGSNTYTLRSEQTIASSLGEWILITATYDGTLPSANMKIYFDSVLDTTLDRTGSAPTNASPVVAGERKIPPDGNCQICYNRGTTIDEIRISNRPIIPSVPQGKDNLPKDVVLRQNYPNPFNPTTTIEFEVPKSSFVELSVFDVLGKKVATLVSEELAPGLHRRTFDAHNFSSGVFFYRLRAGSFVQTKKVVLLR